eukprot:TRINITY_DN23945_c0_g1_i1.p1 TRINITY_DN23945_c0_g1~~TRINITY_DN23945_c0_g1_i1.p1  ORF type:complete len:267 (+),score=117.84 TRINITY_DN23945_c0_g1_i1:69-803(+)
MAAEDAEPSEEQLRQHLAAYEADAEAVGQACDALSAQVRALRLENWCLSWWIEQQKRRERSALEQVVRRDVLAQEQRQAEKQKDKLQAERPIATDANSLVNHFCHSRGIQMPRPEYQQIEVLDPGRQPRTPGMKCTDYICTQIIEMDGQEERFTGERMTTKKDARTSSSVQMLLAKVPGCTTLEEVTQHIQAELAEKRRRKAALPWQAFAPSVVGRGKGKGRGKGAWGRGGRGGGKGYAAAGSG